MPVLERFRSMHQHKCEKIGYRDRIRHYYPYMFCYYQRVHKHFLFDLKGL